MQDPAYQEIKSVNIPKVEKNGVKVTVISGEALGVQGPIQARTPAFYLDFKLDKGTTYEHVIPAGWNSFIYVYEGEGLFGQEKKKLKIYKECVCTKRTKILWLQCRRKTRYPLFLLQVNH